MKQGLYEIDVGALFRRSLYSSQQWWVGRYEYDEGTVSGVRLNALQWQTYSPLQDTPDLFLGFARLYETQDFAESALEWVRHFGFPAEFHYEDGQRTMSLSSILAWQCAVELSVGEEQPLSYKEYKDDLALEDVPAGESVLWNRSRDRPPSMSIDELKLEAHRVWDTFAHYEALVTGEPGRALYLPGDAINPTYDIHNGTDYQGKDEVTLDLISRTARPYIESRIAKEINERCYLRPVDEEDREGEGFECAWGFYDLLGAMYLQMMMIVERGFMVGRCKRCSGALVDRGFGKEDSPKRKLFCGDQCRMAYHRAKYRAK